MTSRRRRVLAVAAVILTAASATLLVADGSPSERSASPDAVEPATTSPPVTTPSSEVVPPARPLPDTADPVHYARSVAVALFTWDTRTDSRAGRAQQLLRQGDPTGVETLGLLTDLDGYLPGEPAWQQLRTYQTTQRLDVLTADIPETWVDVLATHGDDLPNDTTAVTVTGTRHRSGSWDGQLHHTQHPVAFTIFLRCPVGPAGCHILRLSALGRTLS